MDDKYQIFDNFLDLNHFKTIQNVMLESSNFPFFFTKNISGAGIEKDGYFSHMFYYNARNISNQFDLIIPIIESLTVQVKMNVLIRAKANLYTRTDEIVHHKSHIDFNYPHKNAILFLNTNNGFTVLDDNAEIKSVENRLLVFNGDLSHHSTNCTDQQCRLTININFI